MFSETELDDEKVPCWPWPAYLFGLSAAWYTGKLAPMYAVYPPRRPLPTIRPNTEPLIMAHRGYSYVAHDNGLLTYMRVVKEEDHVYQNALNSGLDGLFIDDVAKLRFFFLTMQQRRLGSENQIICRSRW